ncbi:MAG: hypothetical protein ACKO96_19920, partial [Flammeovirgaceae bacterium]
VYFPRHYNKNYMNNLLNDLYNEILGKTWNIESINNRFNAMGRTLRLKEGNAAEVIQIMKDRTQIEELIENISQRFNQMGLELKSFEELNKLISKYYEEA